MTMRASCGQPSTFLPLSSLHTCREALRGPSRNQSVNVTTLARNFVAKTLTQKFHTSDWDWL